MRVAFFCPTVSGTGGVESATRNLMKGFEELGDTVHLFLFGGSYDRGWLTQLPVTEFGSPTDHRVIRLLRYAAGSVRAVAGWKPDAIICSDVTTLEMASMGRRFALGRRMPIASWIHYPLARVRRKEQLRLADVHLAISEGVAQELRGLLPAQADQVCTIFNGIDLPTFPLLPRPAAGVTFLYVGRLTWDEQKRTNDLLTALARVDGTWTLKVVGAPAKTHEVDGERLRGYATDLGIASRVTWLGWQRDPWTAAGEASVLVMPSEHEGFGMVLIEANACGIFSISSDCKSGPDEIINPGVNGQLYPVADVARLAELLQTIVDRPGDLPPQETIRATAKRYAVRAVAQKARESLLSASAHG